MVQNESIIRSEKCEVCGKIDSGRSYKIYFGSKLILKSVPEYANIGMGVYVEENTYFHDTGHTKMAQFWNIHSEQEFFICNNCIEKERLSECKDHEEQRKTSTGSHVKSFAKALIIELGIVAIGLFLFYTRTIPLTLLGIVLIVLSAMFVIGSCGSLNRALNAKSPMRMMAVDIFCAGRLANEFFKKNNETALNANWFGSMKKLTERQVEMIRTTGEWYQWYDKII